MLPDIDELIGLFRQKDRRALSRLLTYASRGQSLDRLRSELAAGQRDGRVIALSGGGGVGKSSLIGRSVEWLQEQGQTVAVLCCDPESPLTGGALLGDRVRISRPVENEGVFIRSLATPGGQQAIARNLDVMIDLLLDYGFQNVIVETVGAGQGDTAVRDVADVVVVLLQPEMGDDLQWGKAGLLEVADIVLVHKADLPGADRVVAQVREQLNLPGCPDVPVLAASSRRGDGLDELWEAIERVATVQPESAPAVQGSVERIRNRSDYERLRQTFRWERPAHFNFGFDVVDRWAQSAGQRVALEWVGPDQPRSMTFTELSERSDRASRALMDLGLERGDRVLVMLPRVIPWWESLVGLLKAALVAIPATTLLTSHDIAYRLRASEASAIIADAEGAEKFEAVAEEFPALERVLVADEAREGWHRYEALLAAASAPIDRRRSGSDEPALIYFTSGTTGMPKMVLHTHASYGLGHQTTGRFWLDLHEDDLHWNVSDTGWAKAAWSSLFGPWYCGASLFVQHRPGRFQPADVLTCLAEYPITTLCAAPTIYRRLVQMDLSDFRPRALRHCVAAGEPLNPEVIAAWRQATGLMIRDGYGQTETVLLCGNFPGVELKPGSMGLPAPGFDLAVIDQAGQPLPPGEEGDLAFRVEPQRPLGMFREYWRDPDATQRALRNGWYVTGDCGRVDQDGYFWFVGRGDDVITSSAYRIGPFEVESALIEHPAVVEAAVIGKPDPQRGQIVKAFVVLAEGYEGADELKAELQQHVKRTTAPYKYPREIEFVEDLPKTVSGKIRRVELREGAS